MSVSAATVLALGSPSSPALAKDLTALRRVVAQVIPSPVPGFDTPGPAAATPTPAPTPSPQLQAEPVAASPSPSPKASRRRGAPLRFSLTGNLTMGERSELSTRGDAASGTLTDSSLSTSTNNAGLLARIERRTASTSFELSVPAGFAVHSTTLGELQAGYYTPRFGFVYGAQPLNFLGGVPLGNTQRGLALVLPLKGGDVTMFDGPSGAGYGAGTERVSGLRARTLYRQTLFEFGAARARATDGSGHIDDFVFGFAQNRGLLSHSFEGAVQNQSDDAGDGARASAYQYRADYGSNTFYASGTVRRTSDGFMSLGSGFMQRDDFASFGIHGYLGRTNASLDSNLERSGTGASETDTRRNNLSLSRYFDRSNVTALATLSDQRTISSFGTTWQGGASGQLGFNIRDISAIVGVNALRTSNSFGGQNATMNYSGALQRQFGSYMASTGYQVTRQTGLDGQLQSVGNVAVTRTFGTTSFTLSNAFSHQLTAISNVIETTPQFTVTRRLSPALALAVNYGEQRTTDKMNPSGNARTRIFGVQIAAPFAIGSGVVQGRIDPNLPATISGIVVDDTNATQFTSFMSAIGNGVGNVAVVLDGNDVQRTDLSGRFQFNFVKPGVHQLRLETASLPRGVTADQPFATLTVLGGQSGQVNFRLGSYGGVEGHLNGRDASGALFPLPNVVLRLDGTLMTTTGPLGAYGFGRLSAGTHVVSIEPTSVAANVGFADLKQTVTVRNGEISVADFTAAPLGSIEGKLVYDRSLAPDFTGPVLNAYVVAEPGEHAAITDDQGNFIIDNLTAGTYTIDVDPETLPEDTGSITSSQTVTLDASGHAAGVTFTIGRKVKQVVFSFKTEETPLTATLSQNRLPPGGSATIAVDAPESSSGVTAELLSKRTPLHYDKTRKKWTGTVIVPLTARGGNVEVTAEINDKKAAAANASLTIDPSMPLVSITMEPHDPVRGQFVHVRARFLADVAPGTSIKWMDGQVTHLLKPISGRVYEFNVKISEQPMRGLLLTQGGELPIILR